MVNISCISLARKGSKRIHGKNFKSFCGKPLIHYTAEIMEKLNLKSYIMTDFDDIKNYVSNNFNNVKIIDMPERFGLDKHDVNGSIKYIDSIVKADIYILLQATSPIRNFNLVSLWIDDFLKNDKESGFSVKKLDSKYIWNEHGKCINFDQSLRDGNGTKKNNIYAENGAFYIFKKSAIDKKHIITDSRIVYFDDYLIDLDTVEDWVKAEKLYMEIHNEKN